MHFTFNIEIDIERITGKFASRDEISGLIFDEISSAIDNLDLSSCGPDSASEYEISHYDVEEQEQPKPVKKPKAKTITVPQDGEVQFTPDTVVSMREHT